MSLELYHWEPTVNSGELLICLHEKGVHFTSRYVDLLAFEQHSPAFLALNPRGEVPVLVHDGHVLTETTLILEYLDAVFPEVPLVPAGAAERYEMRVWTKLANDYFAPAVTLLGWHLRMAPTFKVTNAAEVGAGIARLPHDRQVLWRAALNEGYPEEQVLRARQHLEEAARRMERALAESQWLAGTRYSLADIALFPLASALHGLVPELLDAGSRPHSAAWLRRIGERPAVRAALKSARTARPAERFAPGPELGRWG